MSPDWPCRFWFVALAQWHLLHCPDLPSCFSNIGVKGVRPFPGYYFHALKVHLPLHLEGLLCLLGVSGFHPHMFPVAPVLFFIQYRRALSTVKGQVSALAVLIQQPLEYIFLICTFIRGFTWVDVRSPLNPLCPLEASILSDLKKPPFENIWAVSPFIFVSDGGLSSGHYIHT